MNRFDKSPGNGRSLNRGLTTYTRVPVTDPNCSHHCSGMDCCRVCGPSQSADPWDHQCHLSCLANCGTESTK